MNTWLRKAQDKGASIKVVVTGMLLLIFTVLPDAVTAQRRQADVPGFRPGLEEKPVPGIIPPPKIEIQIPEGASALREKLEKIKLFLRDVQIKGATVFSEKDLKPFYEHLLGKEISLSEIFLIEEKITREYRGNGYILSRALIPEQRITEGVVQLQVIEGFINNISIQGGDDMHRTMHSYLDKLLASRPLHIRELERYLLLVNDLPGVTAKSIVRPSSGGPGAAEIVVMTERDQVNGFISYDNYGSNYSGPEKAAGSVSVNSPAGLGEKLTLDLMRAIPDRELDFKSLSLSFPVGNEGMVLNMKTSHGPSEPGDDLRQLEVKSWSTAHSFYASYPFVRSRNSNLTVEAGYEYKKNTTYLLGARYTEDRIPSIYFKGLYDFIDRFAGTNMITLTVQKDLEGMGVFTSTPEGDPFSTRLQARPTSTILSGDLRRVQSLHQIAGGLNLVLSGFWQYTNEPVYSSEEFGVGGRVYGRGYDMGEIMGDRGVALTTEIQYDSTLFKRKLNYQLYGFFDMGKVWNIDLTDRETANEEPSVESTGLGIRLKWKESLALNAEIAKPLTRVPLTQGDRDFRSFLGIEYTF
jgi:hemolysin activation/secretion protein